MSYIELLPHDTLKIKDPTDPDRKRVIKLYRIISNKTFSIKRPKLGTVSQESSKILYETITIKRYEIGGWVQKLDNLDQTSPVWIDNNAKVLNDALITNGSYIADQSIVYGNAYIDNSFIANYAKIYDDARVINSWVGDLASCKNDCVVKNSKILNQSMIFQKAQINNVCTFGGSFINENATVNNSILKDFSQIGGDANVTNATLSERAVLKESTSGVNLATDPDLEVEWGSDN